LTIQEFRNKITKLIDEAELKTDSHKVHVDDGLGTYEIKGIKLDWYNNLIIEIE